MSTKKQGQEPIQNNVREPHKENSSTSLIEREAIQNTPFWVVGKDKEYFLTLGDYRVGRTMTTKKAARERLDHEKWQVMLEMITVIIDKIGKIEEEARRLEQLAENV